VIAYVSAAFADWKEVRVVQEVVQEMGYIIEDDWTEAAIKESDAKVEWKGGIPVDVQKEIADEHIRASEACHLHVLVCGLNFKDCYGGIGEHFVAQYCGADCDVISPPRNSVFHHRDRVRVFETFDAWRQFMEGGRRS
jgi:hypothetical protein